MTWEPLPSAKLITDRGATVEWAVLGQHIAALAQAEPGTAVGITAYQPGGEGPPAAVQLLTLPEERLAIEVNLSYGTRGSRYHGVKLAGSSARI